MSELSLLVSLAKAQAADSRAAELSSSPAFQCLDNLLRQGVLPLKQVEAYKARYIELHDTVQALTDMEKSLLEKSKELKILHQTQTQTYKTKQLETQQLHQAVQFAQQQFSTLSQQISTLSSTHHSLTVLYDELISTQPEQQNLILEKARESQAGYDSQLNELELKLKNHHYEYEKQTHLLEKENNCAVEYENKIKSFTEKIEHITYEIHIKREKVTLYSHEPDRIKINVHMLEKLENEVEEEYNKINADIESLDTQLLESYMTRKNKLHEMEENHLSVDNYRLNIAKRKSTLDDLAHEQDIFAVKKSTAYDNYSAILEEQNKIKSEIVAIQSNNHDLSRQIEADKKKYEIIRRRKETVISLIKPMYLGRNEAMIYIVHLEEELSVYHKKKNKIKSEVELKILNYLNMEQNEIEFQHEINGLSRDLRYQEEELKNYIVEENHITKQINDAMKNRTNVSRDLSKLQSLLQQEKDELNMKKMSQKNGAKALTDLLATIQLCGAKYENMKNQRNSLNALITTATQSLSELREKTHMLQNEYIVLEQEFLNKEKQRMNVISHVTSLSHDRDSIRGEENKSRLAVKKIKNACYTASVEVMTLSEILQSIETNLTKIRADYEDMIQKRNKIGLKLMDRQDEFMCLQDQNECFTQLIAYKQNKILGRENEIMNVNREISDNERRIEVARKRLPSANHYMELISQEKELKNLMLITRQKVEDLCTQLETPPNIIARSREINHEEKDNSNVVGQQRARLLAGVDPEPEQLSAKMELVEQQILNKKKYILNQELILNQFMEKNEFLKKNVAENRQTVITYHQNINGTKSDLRNLFREMQANISELSMYQAYNLKLAKEKEQVQEKLFRAISNLEQNLPPTVEAESEWLRVELDRQRTTQALLSLHRTAEEDVLYDNIVSHAELRPNAYTDEMFGIPKPYGGLAPFKPSVIGAQMRHYRAPQPKEIQL